MARNTIFKNLYMGITALLVLAFAIGAAGAKPAQAANSSATQVSAGWMSLTGSLRHPQTNSNASFNGMVHMVARWKSLSSGGARVDISANLPAANVTVTTNTGVTYSASGAGQSSIFFPTDPVIPN